MPIFILNNAHKKRNKKRTYVYDLGRGDTGTKSQPCYLVDPPQEFDDEGKELGPDAQVWKTYVKEADRVDEELVDGWNKSMDVNLIFAALFSAISTAFVIESYKNLKPDPEDVSAQTLIAISQTLSLLVNASQPTTATPGSDNEPAIFKASPSAICVNVLWFLSLSLSVAVSLVSMLAKEWCLEFMSGRTGPPGAQARRRQRRWDGLESWKMKEVLMVLPSLIHLSLLLFAIGLCVFLWDVHYGVAIPVVLVTAAAAGAYFACTILPFIYQYCPYGTVLSRLYKQFSSEYSQSVRDGGKQDETTSRALHWMIVNCETPRSVDVALQSLAGAERGLQHEMLERCDAWSMIRHRMDLINPIGEKADPASVLYKRALACHVRTRTQWIFEQRSTEQLVALVLGVQACINSVIYKSLEQPRWLSNRSILEQCRLIGPQLLHFEYRISMTDSALPSLFSDAYSSAIDMHPQRSEALAESLTQLLEQHIDGFIEMEPAQHGALCTSLVLLLSYKIADDPSLIVPYILRLIRAYRQLNDELEHTHSRIQAHRVGNDLSLTTLAFLLGTVAVLNTGCFVKEPPWFSNTLLSDCTSVTRSNALRNRVVELGWQYLLSIVYPGISWFEWNYYLIHGGFHLLAGAREYNLNSEDCIMITKIVPEGYPLSMSSVGEKETHCFAHHLQELTNALTDHPDLDALPSPLLTCLRVLLAMARGLTYLQPSPDSYVLTLKILSWDNEKGEVGEFCRLIRYFPFPKASPRLIDLLSTSGVFTRLINWLESEDFGRQTFAIGQTWLLLNMSIQAPDRKSDAMNKLETMLLEYPGLNNELGEQEAVAEDLECRLLALLNGDDIYRVVELDHDAGIYLYRILELMLQQRCTPLPQLVDFKLQEVHKTLRGIHSFVDLEVEAADRFRSDNVAHDDQESMNDDPSTTSPDA